MEEKKNDRALYMRKYREKNAVPCQVRRLSTLNGINDQFGEPFGCDKSFTSLKTAWVHSTKCKNGLIGVEHDYSPQLNKFAKEFITYMQTSKDAGPAQMRKHFRKTNDQPKPLQVGRKKRTDLVCEMCGDSDFLSVKDLHNHRARKKIHKEYYASLAAE